MTPKKLISVLLPLALFACTSTPSAETSQEVAPIEAIQIQKEWKLIEIDGDTIPTDSKSTLHVDSKLKATGSLGCNRFFGTAELKENTTWDLVSDIEKIREQLNVDTWTVFGGSWGSTLSLSYSIP